ncbi:protoporphyrinogen/coproporphyrinogen oxidase [Litorihabitans aurantiacus]|uniref:Protoporphyrinogen oxidase n=1 Tax=Litorihabitans aurantiacus TaxID=1930061 RepID=A0AA37UHY9_9MICO|nr:FAD-dependent oxidoreductase [Litorihabitans aurantiacus]GMA31233.1 protoporphyrinogen oxidase [Litorihabitans aurantiacus]
MRHVVVVGGGVAGLVTAHDLARAGVPVTVLETADRLGGQVEAIALAGRRLDVGAESFATRGGVVDALLRDLGLADDVVAPAAAPAWVHDAASGRSWPLPAAGVLGIPVRARDAARALGPWGVLRAGADRFLPPVRPAADATVGDVVAARMGARVRDRLVDPVVRGVYSTPASSLALATASPALARELTTARTLAGAAARVRAASPSGSQVAGVRGGMATLVEYLHDAILAAGGTVRTGVRVTGIRADGVDVLVSAGSRGGDGDGAGAAEHLTTERLTTEHLAADHVVVAATGPASRPTLTRRITVVAAAVRGSGLDATPRGTGVLVASGGGGTGGGGATRARALTHSSAKWSWLAARDDVHLVRLSYDAPDADADAIASATPTRDQVERDVRALTGVGDAVVLETLTRTWTRVIAVDPLTPTSPTTVPTTLVGEASGRTGLAAIVAHARASAAALVDRPLTEGAPA